MDLNPWALKHSIAWNASFSAAPAGIIIVVKFSPRSWHETAKAVMAPDIPFVAAFILTNSGLNELMKFCGNVPTEFIAYGE